MNEENTNQLVRASQIEWKPLAEPDAEGIFVKVLQFDKRARQVPDFSSEV